MRFSYRVVKSDQASGNIAHVLAHGDWPVGSDGNPDAKALADHVVHLIRTTGSSCFVLDFTNCSYRGGNSLLESAFAALRVDRDFRYAIVANGDTLSSIKSLVEITGIAQFGFLGCFDDRNQALESFETPKTETSVGSVAP